eukprot:1382037-Amorphochlora_amoeboformis.AAC.3
MPLSGAKTCQCNHIHTTSAYLGEFDLKFKSRSLFVKKGRSYIEGGNIAYKWLRKRASGTFTSTGWSDSIRDGSSMFRALPFINFSSSRRSPFENLSYLDVEGE